MEAYSYTASSSSSSNGQADRQASRSGKQLPPFPLSPRTSGWAGQPWSRVHFHLDWSFRASAGAEGRDQRCSARTTSGATAAAERACASGRPQRTPPLNRRWEGRWALIAHRRNGRHVKADDDERAQPRSGRRGQVSRVRVRGGGKGRVMCDSTQAPTNRCRACHPRSKRQRTTSATSPHRASSLFLSARFLARLFGTPPPFSLLARSVSCCWNVREECLCLHVAFFLRLSESFGSISRRCICI